MEKITNIDFHAHILPGMDHGCKDVNMSLRQLALAKENGIHEIVATSHFYPHAESVNGFLERRQKAYRQLLEAMTPSEGFLKVRTGAEVLICKGMEEMEGLEELCVDGTRVLLLEMPFAGQWEPELTASALALQRERGFQVVLAHVERYSLKQIRPLMEQGMYAQVNADSLTGKMGYRKFRAGYYWNRGLVCALGSDIHGLGHGYERFGAVLKHFPKQTGQVMQRTRELLESSRT